MRFAVCSERPEELASTALPRRDSLPDPRVAAASALLLFSAIVAAAEPGPAVSSPTEIRSLAAESGDTRAEIRIGSDRKPVWTARAEGDVELVLWIAASAVGPAVRDLELPAGLLAAIRVGAGDGTAAGTRFAIFTRRPVGSKTAWDDGELTVTLTPLAGDRSRIEPEESAAAAAAGSRWLVAAAPCLNLRLAPTTAARVVECVPTGTPLAALEETRDWTRLELANGRVGWGAKRYLERPVAGPLKPPLPAPRQAARQPRPEPTPAAPEPEPEGVAPRPQPAPTEPERPAVAVSPGAERAPAVPDPRPVPARPEPAPSVVVAPAPARSRDEGRSTARIGELEARLGRVTSERDELRRRVEAIEAAASAGEEAAQQQVERLEARVTRVSAERDELRRRAEAIEAAASAGEGAAQQADRLEARVTQLSAERDELRRRVEALEARLSQVSAERDELRRRLEALAESPAEALPVAEPRDEGAIAVRPPLAQRPAPAAEAPVTVRPPLVESGPTAEERAAKEAQAAIAAWAAAWSGQRVEDYLAFYAADFRPPDGLDRPAWEAQRRGRLTRPRSIEVEVGNLEVRIDGPERAVARFSQSYRSDLFADRVTKVLELGRRDGLWKIVSERAEP